MSGKFSLEAIFSGKDRTGGIFSQIERNASRMAARTGATFRSLGRGADSLFSGVKAAGIAAASVGVVAGAALYDVISTGATFEKTLIGAAAKFSPAIRKGTEEFEKLRLVAERVGETTEFDAQQSASALKDLASGGFNVQQAISALPGVVDLATAAEIELAAASEIASKSLGAFGLKTTDATQLGINLARVNDNLARTADATSASIEGLFESIKEGGPVATTAGASIETFMAFAGQLSEAGIEGSVAGTTLKNVFLSLAAPSAEAAVVLKKLGIQTKDSSGNLRDAIDIFGELEAATKKMGTGDKASALEGIFGKIPIAGVSSLLDAGTDKLRTLRGELEKAGGSTARMAGIMRDSTTNDIDGFKSALDGVKIAIFGVVGPGFRDLLNSTSKWVLANKAVVTSGLQNFIKQIADNLPTIVEWLGRIGRAVGVLLAIASAVKVVTAAMTVWAIVAAANPMVLIAYTIIAALALIAAYWPEITKHFIDVWDGIKAAFDKGFVQGVFEVLKQLLIHFSPVVWIAKGIDALTQYLFGFSLFEAAGKMIGSFVDGIVAAWTAVVEFFRPAFEFLVGAAVLYFQSIKAIFTPIIALFGWIWGAVKAVFSFWWDAVVAVAGVYFEVMKAIFTPIIEFFAGIWTSVKDAFVLGWDALVGIATTYYEGLVAIFSPLIDFFAGLWSTVADTFQAVFGGILDKIMSAVAYVRGLGQGQIDSFSAPAGAPAAAGVAGAPQVISPAERISRTITETNTKHEETVKIDIKAPPGVAEVKRPRGGGAVPIKVTESGAFDRRGG